MKRRRKKRKGKKQRKEPEGTGDRISWLPWRQPGVGINSKGSEIRQSSA